jgi:hypothetical protein
MTNSDYLYVGVYQNAGGQAQQSGSYFPGLISDVRIYNRALSAAEIQALYSSGK